MINNISSAIKSGHGNAVIYTAALAFIVGDIVPTPADAAYFYLEKKLRDDWKTGKITAKQYWTKETLYYYGLNPLWWTLVLGGLVITKGSFNHKAKIGLAIIGVGAVAAVIYKNMQADIKENSVPPKQ